MPRKKVEHPHVMTLHTEHGAIEQPFPERRAGAVVRGGERIADAMGLAKSTLYDRKDEKNVVRVNSTTYALGKDYRGHLITFTNSTSNWRKSDDIQNQLKAECERKIREGAQQRAQAAPRKQGKFTKVAGTILPDE